MIKKFSKLIFYILIFLNKIFKILTKKDFLIYFKEIHENFYYTSVKINNSNVTFFTPNYLSKYRVDTIFSKEPETLDWIDSFDNNESVFWDIGSNIGLYSIYNAKKNKNTKTFCFEPSTSNLRILSRNISLNNLEGKISIIPLPLSNLDSGFQILKEGSFIEGGALNTFGKDYNFEGKSFVPEMKYKTLGLSINYLLENKIIDFPNYIKIDVDGIEHLILKGADKYLQDKRIKSVSIEINENFEEQYTETLSMMKNFGFNIKHKKNNIENLEPNSPFAKTFNYLFFRQEN